MLDYSYKTILKMAIPLMASTFIQSVVLITDSSFLSRYDTIAFDAVGNGGLIYITLFMTLVGMSDGAQILMARRIGEKKENLLSRIFGSALLNNFLLSILLIVVITQVMPNVLKSYSLNQDVAQGQIDYLRIRSYGLFFAFISLTINAYFMAIGKTKYVLISALFIAFSNIILDYLLISGNQGFEAMGIEGAAIASTFADAIGATFLFFVFVMAKEQKAQHILKNLSISKESLIQLFKISSPIMLQGFVALSTWTVFFTWIEQIGTHELTVSQNIRSLYFLAFVPVWGFGATTKTYVSQYVGNKDYDSIKPILKRIQILSILFLFVFFHGAILYPETMISLVNPNQEFMADSVAILRFVSGSVIIYSLGSIYFHAINGTGNTRHNFYIELLAVIVYLIAAFLFIKVYQLEILWIWTVEYIYFITIGLLSYLYIHKYDWKKKEI
ncbi:MAG TPA: MATE family efflux transporter [Crocinitomicaceae bacterium]|nr:MATE family efflux transporter [Crocinitomicaceae bacterium]